MARPKLIPVAELFYVVELKNARNQVVARQEYPTYGSAMRAVVHFEKTFPEYSVEYRDRKFYK
jgi:hypothetical protein